MAIVSILVGALAMAAADTPADLAILLPAEAHGWRPDGADERADRDGLFSLIDGGAEVYRALDVRSVIERRYAKKGATEIVVDVFDMGSSANAYGAYHHPMREGGSAGVGRESELLGGNLMFWKGRFFAAVVPVRPSPEAGVAVVAIAEAIAAGIGAAGEPPAIVRLLPAEGLVRSQVHYFHDWPLLSMHAFAAGENVLALGRDTEGLLARYRLSAGSPARVASADAGDEQPALLLVRYPTADRARAAHAELAKDPARLAPGHRIDSRLAGKLLLAVVDAPSADAAKKLLDAVHTER